MEKVSSGDEVKHQTGKYISRHVSRNFLQSVTHKRGFNMKSRLLRTFSASLLCLCALTGLSGCMELTMHPATRAWKKQQEEQMRQLTEAQNQQVAQQREQEKSNAAQVAKVAEPKQEQPVVKAQEPPKTESVAQVTDIKQGISEKKNESDDLAPEVDYGSNDAGAPTNYVLLSPAEKAALHWAAAQEYWRLHNTKVNYQEAVILAELHGTTAEAILRKAEENPGEKGLEFIHALPHLPKLYVKWKTKTIEKQTTSEGLINAMVALDQAQKDEQLKPSLNRRGCAWMTGKYYIDSNPTSLCTPVIGKCVEGNCNNGHGSYISFDGSKFLGEFRRGFAFKKEPIFGYGRCLKGNCTNGRGTYAFQDGTKYVGDFKNGKPHGQGTKSWAIGFSYTGEFIDGMDTDQGEYIWPDKHHLSQATCLEGDCKNGDGVLMYENDTKYVGHFKNGVPHGQGIYYWRTGEALEGEFDGDRLKPGGNHISPDGSIVVQNISRGWHKTYAEEKAAAQAKAESEEQKKIIRGLLFREATKIITCHGYHREGSLAWNFCGQ